MKKRNEKTSKVVRCLLATVLVGGYITVNAGYTLASGLEQESSWRTFITEDPQKDATLDKKIAKPSKNKQFPTIIHADHVTFDDQSGDVHAQGNVKISNGAEELLTEKLDGNYRDGVARLDNGGRYINLFTKTEMSTQSGEYNYKTKTGELHNVQGHIDTDIIRTPGKVELHPDLYKADKTIITRCNAKNPDYYAQADYIEIYPNDKLIAHNMQVFVKGKLIYKQAKYVTAVGDKRGISLFPKFSYDSKDGIGVVKRFAIPLDKSVKVYSDIAYYASKGLKSLAGVEYSDSNIVAETIYGHQRDADGKWIQKLPEIKLTYKPQRIGNSIFNYTMHALRGKWKDSSKTSIHTDLGINFYTDPIFMDGKNKSLWLNLGTGYQYVTESYDHSISRNFFYSGVLSKKFNDNLTMYAGYHHNTKLSRLFDFNLNSIDRELRYGVNWKFTSRDTLKVVHRYDILRHKTYDIEYRWQHNLHCMDVETYYNKKDKRIGFNWKIAGF